MKFPEKLAVIDAIQWTSDNMSEVLNFLGFGESETHSRIAFLTATLGEGRKITAGDWIIKKDGGEFDVWKAKNAAI